MGVSTLPSVFETKKPCVCVCECLCVHIAFGIKTTSNHVSWRGRRRRGPAPQLSRQPYWILPFVSKIGHVFLLLCHALFAKIIQRNPKKYNNCFNYFFRIYTYVHLQYLLINKISSQKYNTGNWKNYIYFENQLYILYKIELIIFTNSK